MAKFHYKSGVVIVAALAVAASCRQHVFEFRPDATVAASVTELTIDRPSQSDILFVIDSSGSMQEEQDNLSRNIEKFINKLAESPNKFQIGITTTGAFDSEEKQNSQSWDGIGGRLLSPDGQNPIIRREDYPDNEGLIARFKQTVAAVGTSGSSFEQGLKAAYMALSPDTTGPGLPNAGFVRPDSLQVIIIISDESDCSFSFDPKMKQVFIDTTYADKGESCYALKDQLESPASWGQRIVDIKKRNALVAVGVITGAVVSGKDADNKDVYKASECIIDGQGDPSAQCGCFYKQPLAYCKYTTVHQPPAGSVGSCLAEGCCTALANDRYMSFAEYFGLHLENSICRSEYDQTLFELANIASRDCFTLAEGPAEQRADYLQVKRKLAGETVFKDVPQISAEVGFNGNGWFYLTSVDGDGKRINEVCLAGNYKRVLGDSYRITVINDTSGVTATAPAR